MSPLSHFTNIETATWHIEPVYKKLAEAEFYEDNKLSPIPLFTEQLYKIEGNKMHFNLNWNIKDKEIIPLNKIVELIKNKTHLTVNIAFHDREGMIMYKTKMDNFKFTKILNDSNFDYNQGDFKDLIVEYEYERKEILV